MYIKLTTEFVNMDIKKIVTICSDRIQGELYS